MSDPVERHHRTPLEALVDCSLKHADAGDDDEEYRRALDNLKHFAKKYGRRMTADKIRRSLKLKQARGEHVGRPPTSVDAAELERVRRGEQRAIDVATRLGVSRRTIQRHLKRVTKR